MASFSMETRPPLFPNEILRHILSYVDSTDRLGTTTLATFCRSCKLFYEIGQELLYKTPYLIEGDPTNPFFDAFERTVTEDAKLGLHVRAITMVSKELSDLEFVPVSPSDVGCGTDFSKCLARQSVDTAKNMLAACPNLEELALEYLTVNNVCHWIATPPKLHTLYLTRCAMISGVSELGIMELLGSLQGGIQNMDAMIDNLGAALAARPPPPTPPPNNITSLSLNGCTIGTREFPPTSFVHLKSLSLAFHASGSRDPRIDSDHRSLFSFIEDLPVKLRALRLDDQDATWPDPERIGLYYHLNLLRQTEIKLLDIGRQFIRPAIVGPSGVGYNILDCLHSSLDVLRITQHDNDYTVLRDILRDPSSETAAGAVKDLTRVEIIEKASVAAAEESSVADSEEARKTLRADCETLGINLLVDTRKNTLGGASGFFQLASQDKEFLLRSC